MTEEATTPVAETPDVTAGPAEFALSDAKDAFLSDDVQLTYSDDGEFELAVAGSETPAAEAPQGADLADADPAGDTSGPATAEHNWEQRYKDAQAWGTSLTQEKAELTSRLDKMEGMMEALILDSEAPVPDTPAEQENPLADFDPQVAAYIQQAIDAGVAAQIAPIQEQLQPVLTDQAVQSELREVLTKYPDFPAYAERVYDLFEKAPNSQLTYEQAYEVVKTLGGVDSPPATAESQQIATPQATPAASTAPPGMTKEEIIAKASRLQTETSQTNDQGFEPSVEVTSIFDAMQSALEEM